MYSELFILFTSMYVYFCKLLRITEILMLNPTEIPLSGKHVMDDVSVMKKNNLMELNEAQVHCQF